MTIALRRNRLTTHFSERILVVKRHMTVLQSIVLFALNRYVFIQLLYLQPIDVFSLKRYICSQYISIRSILY